MCSFVAMSFSPRPSHGVAALDGRAKRTVRAVVAEVESAVDARKRGGERVLCVLVLRPDVRASADVAHDMPPKAPLVAEDVPEKILARAARNAVDSRVRAHHALDLRLLDERLERGEVVLVEVALVDVDVEAVALRLWAGMDGVVLRAGGGHQEVWIVALEPLHELDAHARGEVRVLAERLLSAAPARIAEHVDVRTPQREARVEIEELLRAEEVVLGARLYRDGIRHLPLQRSVECRRAADRLWEDRGESAPRDAVERLVPERIARNAELRPRRRASPEECDAVHRRLLRDDFPRTGLALVASRVGRNREKLRRSRGNGNGNSNLVHFQKLLTVLP